MALCFIEPQDAIRVIAESVGREARRQLLGELVRAWVDEIPEQDLQSHYDVVIIDSPPAKKYADAQSIAYRAGDALIVARKDHTSVMSTSKVVKELAGTGARVVGTIVNAY